MRCAPRVSNGPNHLGLCARQAAYFQMTKDERQQEIMKMNDMYSMFDLGDLDDGAGTPQHGLSSNKMALINSDFGATRSLSIKWP